MNNTALAAQLQRAKDQIDKAVTLERSYDRLQAKYQEAQHTIDRQCREIRTLKAELDKPRGADVTAEELADLRQIRTLMQSILGAGTPDPAPQASLLPPSPGVATPAPLTNTHATCKTSARLYLIAIHFRTRTIDCNTFLDMLRHHVPPETIERSIKTFLARLASKDRPDFIDRVRIGWYRINQFGWCRAQEYAAAMGHPPLPSWSEVKP